MPRAPRARDERRVSAVPLRVHAGAAPCAGGGRGEDPGSPVTVGPGAA